MKTLTEYLLSYPDTSRLTDITPQVEEIVRKSGVKEGMVLVSAMHITAGVYVNDNGKRLDRGHRPVAGTSGAVSQRLQTS